MTDPRIEFIFGEMKDHLKGELNTFWTQYGKAYQDELKLFSVASSNGLEHRSPLKKPILRQPAAISRDESGLIDGIIFVVLRELEVSLELGSHAYFQRMYIKPASRHPRLANQLFRAFLIGFDHAEVKRDYRANFLLTENINPALHKSSMRRYFSRLGFRMLGGNQFGGEVWVRKLKTHFSF